jgi:hypothetical protein
LAGIGAAAWWQFAVSYENPSEAVTLRNVNTHVQRWVFAFPDFFTGARIEEEHRPDMYFAYHLIFADGYGVGVSRNKDQWGRFITLASSLITEGEPLAAYSNLSDNQKQRVIRDLTIEISRAKIPVAQCDPSKPIVISTDIPINAALTEMEFYNSIREMHAWLGLIAGTLDRLLTETRNDNK